MKSRRQILRDMTTAGALLGMQAMLPAWARSVGAVASPGTRRPRAVAMDIAIREERIPIAGGAARAMTLNGTVPGPLVELYEGEDVTLRVTNHLAEDSSIHWHGILLPFEMDGVPGVTFPGIAPGGTFEARFRARQSGTYWYHSHSGLQEQSGVYGPIVVHPSDPEPVLYDRDHVVVLSDWTFEDPYDVLANLKKSADYYNYQRRTVGDLVADLERQGMNATLDERLTWARMRMMPSDIADVTGVTYTYLLNGGHPGDMWRGRFDPGQRVRLRVINASAMSFFNFRIPGLPMKVIAADGQNVEPVEADEFQIGVAETYDVIVEPTADRAWPLVAESMDRSGMATGVLAARTDQSPTFPTLRTSPRRTMVDMGMAMASEDSGNGPGAGHTGRSMSHGSMTQADDGPGPIVARHGPDEHGFGNITVARVQRNRLGEPGTGLDGLDHRVLRYTDLRSRVPVADPRPPGRDIELHLTGNMERYMWSFDGRKFSEVDGPIHFEYGERLRLVLVNDTMMEHPIHLHGMFMDLENGQGEYLPRKHTISLKASSRASLLITADEPGRWAFHCHLLYHMKMGMFRVVEVS